MSSIPAILITGFTIGLFGSLHCAGMCGPLALSLPFYSQNGIRKVYAVALYNLGRAGTYTLFGLLFGFTGRGLYIFGIQQWISLISGITILCILFLPGIFRFSFAGNFFKQSSLLSFFSRHLHAGKNIFFFYSAGMVNGLLPCGLVYIAIASSVATGSPAAGALLMFSFGVGTMPLMIITILMSGLISSTLRSRLKVIVPVFACLIAVILIIRGLGLNIPFLSPVAASENIIGCHKGN